MDPSPENFARLVQQVQAISQARDETVQAYNLLQAQYQQLSADIIQAKDNIARL